MFGSGMKWTDQVDWEGGGVGGRGEGGRGRGGSSAKHIGYKQGQCRKVFATRWGNQNANSRVMTDSNYTTGLQVAKGCFRNAWLQPMEVTQGDSQAAMPTMTMQQIPDTTLNQPYKLPG